MEQLKPCPFCGGEAKVLYLPNKCGWNVYCRMCEVEMLYDSEQEAIEAWNRRVDDE